MKKKKIILKIYEEVKESITPNAEYIKEKDKFVELRELFLKEIGYQYREKLDRITDAIFSMTNELDKQLFYEGYKTAETLLRDNNNKRGI